MVRSLLRDRLGDDSPLPASARIKRVWYRALTPFLSRSLIHWGEAAVGAGAVTVTWENGLSQGIEGGGAV